MRRKLLSTGFFVMLLGFSGLAQTSGNQVLSKHLVLFKNTPTATFPTPNMEAIRLEDEQRDRNGELYRIGVYAYTDITTDNSGGWTISPNGDRIWQCHVKFFGAEALGFLFSKFKIYGGTTVDVFNNKGERLHRTLTKNDVLEHFQQHIELCFGDEMTLQIAEPEGTQPSEIHIDHIIYNYRSTGNPSAPQKINESDDCEVNVNCIPVGNNWQDEKRGVARILVVGPTGSGWCSGTLTNNTAQDCKPLFLTALHCGEATTTSQFNQWKFYFGYEAPGCTNPAIPGSLDDHLITGCVKLASSNDGGGDDGSDFLLVQLGTLANETATVTTLKSSSFNAYWNGWDANNVAVTGGVGIHHPAGDIKKISTFNGSTISTSWGGTVANTHWQLSWSSNANGYGVTEGGSSGSPLFNSSGRQIGTLTGGSSFCNTPTSPDAYGKMSYHWTSNGAPANERLKTYLDPGNTGLMVLDGSNNPCAVGAPNPPVAQFVGVPTTVDVGGTVQFTDQSSNAPSSWSWSITPGTGWSYTTGGSTSQNPAVTFTAQGQYTVTLTATNAAGSDAEIKSNYIIVTASTGPCTAASSQCDEFIQNVTLETINNTSACTNYTSYSASATLVHNEQYLVTVTPQIGNDDPGTVYIGDEVAVWIDWNGDDDLSDVGEQIGYTMISQVNTDTQYQFTVPGNATVGQVTMRVRISFSGDGFIEPCGYSPYGEVEDYVINILSAPVGLQENDIFAAVAVYPNPATDMLSVDLSKVAAENVTISLVDMTGKTIAVQQSTAGAVAQFDLSVFAKGLYQVRITDGASATVRKVSKI